MLRKAAFAVFALAACAVLADQVIEPQNYGPPYMYPDSAKNRLFKLPYKAGTSHTVTGAYGSDPASGYHHPDYSVDFDLVQGEAIHAVRAGTVNLIYPYDTVCNLPTSQGNKVIVLHQDSMPDSTVVGGWRKVYTKDLYLHVNHDIPVRPGQKIAQGQIVAYASCTGQDGGGPHLHYKTWVDSIVTAQYTWRHLGWFSSAPTYFFGSIPTPFVEITSRPNGLPEMGDTYISQNVEPTEIEGPAAEAPEGALSPVLSPNPFTPGTSLFFFLAKTARVTAEVYSPAGRRIAKLADGPLGPGNHSFAWSAKNAPCGLYLVKITAGASTSVVKALLVR
jgi:murein DD-endopeptidase MepM/ murein hydrolase activator NlpD